MYRARVLGEFPEQSELSVYSLAWIERASHEPEPLPNDGRVRLIRVVIDVAGPGEDETVLVARVGGVIVAQQAWSLADPRGELVAALGQLNQNRRFRVGPVMVDTVGIGFHVATHLADHGYDVHAFNAGGAAIDSEHFVNAKAEAYWGLREALERGAVKRA